MKLAIVSDLHIGYERFYEDAYIQAKEALDMASAAADAVLLPGDIFDRRNPKPEVMAQAVNLFRDLKEKKWNARVSEFRSTRGAKAYTDVPIIAIPGTHERTMEGRENPISVLALAGLLIDTSEATSIIEKDGEMVSVYGMGGLSEETIREKIPDVPKPEGLFSVFMFHQSVYELLPFNDHFIHLEDLPAGFDLYIDGHIHNKIIGKVHEKELLIPGSTVLTQLKESEQEPKGFFVYDTETGKYEFRKINSRPFVFLDLEFEDATPELFSSRAEMEIERVIKSNSTKPIIKLRIKGNIMKGFKSIDMPVRALRSKFLDSAFLEIDMSKLADIETQESIEELREGKFGNMSVKEMGMSLFSSKLKESGMESKINYVELFNILSTNKKETALKEAMELFENIK